MRIDNLRLGRLRTVRAANGRDLETRRTNVYGNKCRIARKLELLSTIVVNTGVTQRRETGGFTVRSAAVNPPALLLTSRHRPGARWLIPTGPGSG